MSINATRLFSAYDALSAIVGHNPYMNDEFGDIQTAFEDKRRNPDAKIMVYGIYNSGKSTLINALLGAEVADTDDVPKTDRVDTYQWRQYQILDTPGIDAPIEHEQVTNEELLKADGVVFVANPIGVAEEAKTLSVLMDLVEADKQVFLVFNEKSEMDEELFATLKDQTRARLQSEAGKRGLKNVLKDIPMIKVNAKRALTGRLKKQPKLFAASNFQDLERELSDFLNRFTEEQVYGRLKNSLVQFAQQYLDMLQSRTNNAVIKKYDRLLQHTESNKAKINGEIIREISSGKAAIQNDVRAMFRNMMHSQQELSQREMQTRVETLFKQKAEQISILLESEVQYFVQKIQQDIEDLQASLPTVNTDAKVDIQNIDGSTQSFSFEQVSTGNSGINPEAITQTVNQLTGVLKSEHIVTALQLVKTYIPSLMKGVGIKGMEKIAASIMSKAPYIGTFISIGFGLLQAFQGDPASHQMQQQIEEQNRQRERAEQQIEDNARDISNQFESMMYENTKQAVEQFFAQVSAQIQALRKGFSDEEQNNSKLVEEVSAVSALIQAA